MTKCCKLNIIDKKPAISSSWNPQSLRIPSWPSCPGRRPDKDILYTISNDLGRVNLKFPIPSPLVLALVSAFFSDSSYIPSASPLPLLTPSSVGQSHSPPDHCILTILPHINQDRLLTFFSSSLALFFANLSLTCQDKFSNMSELLKENQEPSPGLVCFSQFSYSYPDYADVSFH